MYLALTRNDEWEVWRADPPRPWHFRRLKEYDLIIAMRPDADFQAGEPVYVYGRLTVTGATMRDARTLLGALQAEVAAMADDLARWCASWEANHPGRMLEPWQWGWVDGDGAILRRDPAGERDAWYAYYSLYAHDIPADDHGSMVSREQVVARVTADLTPLLNSLHGLRRGA